jgi:CRISPR/Cas system-associated exonuclease Cas4 (RecB family)
MIRHVSLYNGAVNIEFDPDKHYYHVVGSNAKPDGVTTILGLIPKYLLPWVARTTADYIHAGILERLAGEGAVEPTFLASLCDEAKKEHTRKKEAAGDVGTLVHAFAEDIIVTGYGDMSVLPAKAKPGCQAFLQWWGSVEIDPATIESERIVFSRRLFYCGTCDLFATINGKPTVVDFKTGSGFYEDQPLQLAAYAMAIEEELGIEIKDGWIIHLDKETGKCTPYHVEIDHELKADWEQVRIAWRAVKRNQARHKQIKEKQKCQQLTNTIQAAAQA